MEESLPLHSSGYIVTTNLIYLAALAICSYPYALISFLLLICSGSRVIACGIHRFSSYAVLKMRSIRTRVRALIIGSPTLLVTSEGLFPTTETAPTGGTLLGGIRGLPDYEASGFKCSDTSFKTGRQSRVGFTLL